MNSYKYNALSADGVKVKGIIEAVDEYQAVEKIKEKCPIVISVDEVQSNKMNSILNKEVGKKLIANLYL